ncbi:cytochrome P450 [Streptomyces sp. NPDC020965]|uniref:cytochrome P450 n=1 Tax=Streptomyces sp. NPDC020965 TaxID=3365105 RepID=UPI003790B25A
MISPRTDTAPVALTSDGGRRLYEQADELRADGPAVRVRLPEDLLAWSVTRGDVVKRILTHPDVSKDARRSWPGYRPGAIAWLYPWVDTESMFTADGADHTRLRKLIGPTLTPRRIEALRPRIEAIVTELLDALEARDTGGTVDLRSAFTHRLPTRLICDLFGVPVAQRASVLRVVEAVVATGVTAEESARLEGELIGAMRELVQAKRREPGDDMTSLLLRAQDGDRLTETELISTLLLMIGAGSQTTVALLGHAVRALLAHPGQLEAVRADPTRWNDVIEETLRLHSPVMHLPLRFATRDIDLGDGVTVPAGDAILVGFGAHGRDPGVHDAADTFDIDRADKAHLAFGHGIHFCLGAPLAKLEARIALPALFDRFPRIGLAGDSDAIAPTPSFISTDFTALPVRLRRCEPSAS